MRKARRLIPGAENDIIIVHKIDHPFCLCEMPDGSMQLLPTISIQFIESPEPNMDARTTIASMAMLGMLANGRLKKDIIIMNATKIADELLTELKSNPIKGEL